jgi:hypothetical protein
LIAAIANEGWKYINPEGKVSPSSQDLHMDDPYSSEIPEVQKYFLFL